MTTTMRNTLLTAVKKRIYREDDAGGNQYRDF